MRPYQIGLLVAAAAVSGALYVKLTSPKAEPAPAAASQAAAPAATPLTPEAPAPPAAKEPEAKEERPSPLPEKRESRPARREQKSTARPAPVTVAQSQPAAQQPAAAPPPPAPAVSEPPRPVEEKPANVFKPEETKPAPRQPQTVTIPAGTTLNVRLDETLDSERNQSGDSFSATLDAPLVIDGFVIAGKGSRVEGKIAQAERAGRVRGLSFLSLELTRLKTSDGQRIDIRTDQFSKQGETSKGDDAKKIGAGAGIGAAIGAIAGGGKGAAIGAAIGGATGAGGVLATRGKAATLPAETRLSFRLSNNVSVTEKLR